MSMSAKLRRTPTRLITGGFILNSGLSKLSIDDDGAKQIHGLASGAYPFVEKIPPKTFAKTVAVGEIALGSALVLPIVPTALAGLGLAGFSAGLLGIYWRTPGMHEEGSLRPTHQGMALAKDSWMFAVGTSLILDAVLEPAHDKKIELTHGAKAATARRAAKATSNVKVARAKAEARAAKAARKASKQARRAQAVSRAAFDRVTP